MLGRSSGNRDWLLANASKRLRFLRFSFTQRTQRKRLRLNGNRALASFSRFLATVSQSGCARDCFEMYVLYTATLV